MRVVQINSTCGIGSTGKIAVSISDLLSLNNIDNEIGKIWKLYLPYLLVIDPD